MTGGSIARVPWAMAAVGLTPEAKLILILAADAADMDGHAWNLDKLAGLANVTPELFAQAVAELDEVGLAEFASATHPGDGERRRCLKLLADGGAS